MSMKKLLALVMAAVLILPGVTIAQGEPIIEAGTVWVVVAVYDGLGWVPVADGIVPPTYISCQPQ